MLLLLAAIDIFYLVIIWPDWDNIEKGRIGKSAFIKKYETRLAADASLPALNWQTVPMKWIPQDLKRAVLIGEDARFYEHSGFDITAFKEAMDYNLEKGEIKYGASTISQQTVKNMFLSARRDPLRKWHELILTVAMEHNLSKTRILETYLNIAEFGKGIYGVEAASQYYWRIPVYRLGTYQAIELAATLPSPIKHNPKTRTRQFLRRVRKINRWMQKQ